MREQSRLRILQNAYTLVMLMAILFFIISQFFLNKSLVPSPIKRFLEVKAVTKDFSNYCEALPILFLMLSPQLFPTQYRSSSVSHSSLGNAIAQLDFPSRIMLAVT